MTIYLDVPVREDRLAEVFALLSIEPPNSASEPTKPINPAPEATEPLHSAAEPIPTPDEPNSSEPVATTDASTISRNEIRDHARWDAYWAVEGNIRKHLTERSELIRAITRAVAEHADAGWITTEDIANDIGESPSSVASALGPLAKYLTNRDLAWPFSWRYGKDRIEYKMAPGVAATVLNVL